MRGQVGRGSSAIVRSPHLKNKNMTFFEECGIDYDYYDIPPAIRKRDNEIITREIEIPIIQLRDNYTNAAADYAEIISK